MPYRDIRSCLEDILDAITEIQDFVVGKSIEDYRRKPPLNVASKSSPRRRVISPRR